MTRIYLSYMRYFTPVTEVWLIDKKDVVWVAYSDCHCAFCKNQFKRSAE